MRWWEAEDDCQPLRRAQLTDYVSAELPVIRMDDWRNTRWPDRPHP